MISSPEHLLQKMKTRVHTKIYMPMFTNALSVTAPNQKQPQCASKHE